MLELNLKETSELVWEGVNVEALYINGVKAFDAFKLPTLYASTVDAHSGESMSTAGHSTLTTQLDTSPIEAFYICITLSFTTTNDSRAFFSGAQDIILNNQDGYSEVDGSNCYFRHLQSSYNLTNVNAVYGYQVRSDSYGGRWNAQFLVAFAGVSSYEAGLSSLDATVMVGDIVVWFCFRRSSTGLVKGEESFKLSINGNTKRSIPIEDGLFYFVCDESGQALADLSYTSSPYVYRGGYYILRGGN